MSWRRLGDLGVGGVDDVRVVALQQQGVAEIGRMARQRGLGAGVVGILAQRLDRRIGGDAVADARLRLGDEVGDSRQLLIDGARRDQPQDPGDLTRYSVSRVFASGRPNKVNDAGAGSVSHIASMAAIFIF